MAKKKEAVKNITELTELTKDCTYLDALYNEAFIFFPEKENWRKRIIYTLRKWIQDPSAIIFEDFLFKYNIPYTTWLFWTKQHEDIKAAHLEARRRISANRKRGSMNYSLNWNAAYYDIHTLDPDWEEMVDDYKARKKKQESGDSGKLEVIIPNYKEKENGSES